MFRVLVAITLLVVPGLYALVSRWAGVPGATNAEVDRQLKQVR